MSPLPPIEPPRPPLGAPFEPAPRPPVGFTGLSAASPIGAIEVIALLGIGLGWLVPGPGFLIGVIALVLSPKWTAGEKVAATIIPLVLIAIPFFALLHDVLSPGDLFGDVITFVIVAVVVWPISAIYLWVKLLGRRAAARRAA